MEAAIKDLLSKAKAGDNSTTVNGTQILGGRELLFYDIKNEDRELWEELISYGDDKAIHNVIKASKSHLLTRVIGNPEDPVNKILKHNEAHYGNIMLHNRMIQAHDQSVIKLRNPESARIKLLQSNCKGADYLLRYYELKQKNALTTTSEKAAEKRADISIAINYRDIEGKTPLLLACKNVNQQYALRLINLDEKGTTLNSPDKVENRTPLHIACILGLKEVVQNLIKFGANKELIDVHGHKPFYYLTCSDEEKRRHMQEVLDSVDFFYGRYFDSSDRKHVVTELLNMNNILRTELTEQKILTPTYEGYKNEVSYDNKVNSAPKLI